MEKGSVLFKIKSQRVFHELYEKIFSFLDFSSLIQALVVSTDFYNLLNKQFKNFLVSNNLIEAKDKQVTGDHYLKLFRTFYSREVLIADLLNIKESFSELRMMRYPRCSTYGVKSFTMGTKFIIFHLYNNDIIFLKYEEYTNPNFDMRSINQRNIRKNVLKYFTKSKDLFYLNSSGHLHVIFYEDNIPSYELYESLLEMTIHHPLSNFSISNYHAVLFVRVSEPVSENLIYEENKDDNSIKTQIWQDIRYLNLHSITPEDFNAPVRLKKIDGLDSQKVQSFCVGNASAYFINAEESVFECDFSVLNNEKLMIFPYTGLKDKKIKKLWCGYNFYFALEQGEVESIDSWTQLEILQWVLAKNFNRYRNIIKYENVSGKDLLLADRSFLKDRLGMTKYLFSVSYIFINLVRLFRQNF